MEDAATQILQSLVDDQPDPTMGSEYLGARRYLALLETMRRKPTDVDPAHGANESDFGAMRLAD